MDEYTFCPKIHHWGGTVVCKTMEGQGRMPTILDEEVNVCKDSKKSYLYCCA